MNDSEEAEYGTDPNNSDTDGDGLSDGKEVADGTDPLVADVNSEDDEAKGASCSTVTEPAGLWPMLLMMLPFYRRRK